MPDIRGGGGRSTKVGPALLLLLLMKDVLAEDGADGSGGMRSVVAWSLGGGGNGGGMGGVLTLTESPLLDDSVGFRSCWSELMLQILLVSSPSPSLSSLLPVLIQLTLLSLSRRSDAAVRC